MDDVTAEELRSLRDRAYGPRADIHDDPVALARLRQLEQLGRRPDRVEVDEPPTPVVSTTPGDPAPPRPAAIVLPDERLAPAPGEVPPAAEKGSRRWFAWAWIASVVVAAVLGGAIAVVAGAAGDRPVGTMRVDADFVWPEFLGTATSEVRGYTQFSGMTAVTSNRSWEGPGTDTCLLILTVSDAAAVASDGRILRYACGTTAFPATVQFEVTEGMPDELIERFPIGTDLQFVLVPSERDDLDEAGALDEPRVDVFARGE